MCSDVKDKAKGPDVRFPLSLFGDPGLTIAQRISDNTLRHSTAMFADLVPYCTDTRRAKRTSIAMRTHDSLRNAGDMLAWVRQVITAEGGFSEGLFGVGVEGV